MTRLFAFGVSTQLVAIGYIPTYRLISAFVILKIIVLSSCFQSVRFGLDLQIVIFAASSVNRCINTDWMELGELGLCSIADGFCLIAVLSQSSWTKVTLKTWSSSLTQPFWSQWDRRFFAQGCNNIGHPRSPPTVFSSVTVLQWLNWSINGIHLFNGAVEHFFTQTCYFLRCWWESL